MPRTWRPSRIDANHREIVAALRLAGATVQDLSAVGCGCPDLLAGYRGQNFLLEVKDGEKAPSMRKLTDAQAGFILLWRGQRVRVVGTVDEALAAIGAVNPLRDTYPADTKPGRIA